MSERRPPVREAAPDERQAVADDAAARPGGASPGPPQDPASYSAAKAGAAQEAVAPAERRRPWAGLSRGGRSSGRDAVRQVLTTAAILTTLLIVWAVGSAAELWSPAVLPAPADVFSAAVDMVQTPTFWEALRITVTEIVVTFGSALVLGFLAGMLFWKVPYLGRVFEPYLVSFYAVPFIVFYPVMVVLIGLNSIPIIILATVMAIIPMTLNTWIGLSGVREVFWKLAASLECNRRQTMFRIAIPAAAPIVLAGVRLAMIYSLIGSVSMEFLLAPNGLGFQIRYQYELFQQGTMLAYVLVVFTLAGMLAVTIAALETWVLGRRRPA